MDSQWERAHQAWSLSIAVGMDALSADQQRAARRILRVKRSERAAFEERIPGVVRRGARVDLVAIESDLRAAGIACSLVQTVER